MRKDLTLRRFMHQIGKNIWLLRRYIVQREKKVRLELLFSKCLAIQGPVDDDYSLPSLEDWLRRTT